METNLLGVLFDSGKVTREFVCVFVCVCLWLYKYIFACRENGGADLWDKLEQLPSQQRWDWKRVDFEPVWLIASVSSHGHREDVLYWRQGDAKASRNNVVLRESAEMTAQAGPVFPFTVLTNLLTLFSLPPLTYYDAPLHSLPSMSSLLCHLLYILYPECQSWAASITNRRLSRPAYKFLLSVGKVHNMKGKRSQRFNVPSVKSLPAELYFCSRFLWHFFIKDTVCIKF